MHLGIMGHSLAHISTSMLTRARQSIKLMCMHTQVENRHWGQLCFYTKQEDMQLMLPQCIKIIRLYHFGIPRIGDSRNELIKGYISLEELMMMIEPSHMTLGMLFHRPQNQKNNKIQQPPWFCIITFILPYSSTILKSPPND